MDCRAALAMCTIQPHLQSMGGIMTAPLYEVKSKFSEFVNMVQDGETLCITRHGKVVAVMISSDEYEQKTPQKKTFLEAFIDWKNSCDPDLEDDYDPWAKELVRDPDPNGGRKEFTWD